MPQALPMWSVLGQREDGAVLMLVIDGRQAHSNAANLDGGSSSMLVYEGEVKNVCASLYGSRPIPTAFVVL
ncbi:phosphodiester glycosidase family protein [Ruthenibacterium lactatiformans]|uniref:phosphodiester glycosidase family protein n=1 Tax=Ruthenibacterium lactatiformans TaxID=1550024 RepID=UPI002EB97784|nr:phosphodiester glycosidase family protein [Oscillospiraceae bacterium]